MKKNAFTLAEVLITLVIIGVIAAMTIPTLMGSTNRQEMRSRYTKALSMINQAASLEYALYGHECNPDDPGSLSMLKNHMSVIQDNGNSWKTADGMIFNVGSDCYIGIDLNGEKGRSELGVDYFTAVVNLTGPVNNRHTFTPNPWDENQESIRLYNGE